MNSTFFKGTLCTAGKSRTIFTAVQEDIVMQCDKIKIKYNNLIVIRFISFSL